MKLIHDTRLLFARNMLVSLRTPIWIFIGLFQPLLYLLLFAPLLEGMDRVPGFPPGGPLQVFTPGLLIMMAMFGTSFAGFALIPDLRAGVVERLRVTPVSRLALLLGLVLRDVVLLVVQCLLLVLVALVMGLRPDPLGVIMTFGLLVLIAVLLASFSYAVALAVNDEGGLASTLNMLTVPLLLLSGITLPLTLAPSIISSIAQFNPFSHAVNAARALFNGNLSDSSVALGFGLVAVLVLLTLWWAVRSFRQATA